jgi:hypothetical protein
VGQPSPEAFEKPVDFQFTYLRDTRHSRAKHHELGPFPKAFTAVPFCVLQSFLLVPDHTQRPSQGLTQSPVLALADPNHRGDA